MIFSSQQVSLLDVQALMKPLHVQYTLFVLKKFIVDGSLWFSLITWISNRAKPTMKKKHTEPIAKKINA